MPTYTGHTPHEAIIKALMHQCQPCCGESGSPSDEVPFPNGCAACEECCICVCWWYTTWHKLLAAANFVRDTLTTPVWTLVSNGLVNVGGDPDYLYLGSIGGGQIGGLYAIDGAGDVTGSYPPNPKWEGDLVYSNGSESVTVNVTIILTFILPCPCDGEYADQMVWSGTSVNSVNPPTYTFDLNGTITPPLSVAQAVDYSPIPNDIIGGSGTMADCGGTWAIDGAGMNMPDLTIVPMYDPDCVG